MSKFNVKPVGTDKVEVLLPDGLKLTGTVASVQKTLQSLGYSPSLVFGDKLYYSDSKGWVNISTMATPHLRNAILKRYNEWVDELRTLSNKEILNSLENGPENLLGLIGEFGIRVAKGE